MCIMTEVKKFLSYNYERKLIVANRVPMTLDIKLVSRYNYDKTCAVIHHNTRFFFFFVNILLTVSNSFIVSFFLDRDLTVARARAYTCTHLLQTMKVQKVKSIRVIIISKYTTHNTPTG